MNVMTFLESAIGVVFAFLVVSLFVTAANELIAAVFALRAKKLEEGVTRMLGGDGKLAGLLFSHPLIQLSSRSPEKKPSYIQREDFAEVLLDLISSKGSLSSLGGHYKAGFYLAKAVEEALPAGQLRNLLTSFAEGAKNDVEAFRKKAEAWFDSSMERVSGWYNRKVRGISLLIGLAIACAANVDTLVLASRLAVDEEARAKVVGQALDYLKQGQPQSGSGEELKRIDAIVSGDLARLEKGGLIGWGAETRIFVLESQQANLVWNILLKVLGLLVTAAAVSLGAPFWFDVLGKLASIRTSQQPGSGESAGAKPAAPAATP
jgi:hypothetical protein